MGLRFQGLGHISNDRIESLERLHGVCSGVQDWFRV